MIDRPFTCRKDLIPRSVTPNPIRGSRTLGHQPDSPQGIPSPGGRLLRTYRSPCAPCSPGKWPGDKHTRLLPRFAAQGQVPAGGGLHHTQELCHVQGVYGVHAAGPQQAAGNTVCAQQMLVELDGKGLLFAVRPLVLGEVGAPAERFATLVTFKRPLPRVGFLMFNETVVLAERPAALAALIGPLARVDPLVHDEGRLAAEGLPAPAAVERLLPRVDPLVHDEVGVGAEGLPALVALEGLLPAVDPLVHGQVGVADEALAAVPALEGLLARVDPLVEGEARPVVEGLGAVAAFEGLVAVVDLLMHGQGRVAGEGLAALAAPVRLLPRVDPVVPGQVRPLVEGLPALAALVGLLPGVHPAVHAEQRAAAEGLLAARALVGPLARVRPVVHVQRRVAAEGLAALAAEEGLLPGVAPLVLQEVGPPGEGLAALATPVGLLPGVPALVQGEGRALVEGLPALATREEPLPGPRARTPVGGGLPVFTGPAAVSPRAGWQPRVLGDSLPGLAGLGASVRRPSLRRNEGPCALLGGEGASEGQSLHRRPVSLPLLLCGTLPTAGGPAPPEHSLTSRQSGRRALPGPPGAWTEAVETGPQRPLHHRLLCWLVLVAAPLPTRLLTLRPGLPLCKKRKRSFL